tara:strand:+ start:3304 stop:3894 length:591 start_codon:yes stop_codon:yes gene_type:complete
MPLKRKSRRKKRRRSRKRRGGAAGGHYRRTKAMVIHKVIKKIKKELQSITKENYDNDYNGDFFGDNFKNKVKENLFDDTWECGLDDHRYTVNCRKLDNGKPYYIVDEIFQDKEKIQDLFAKKIEEMNNEEKKAPDQITPLLVEMKKMLADGLSKEEVLLKVNETMAKLGGKRKKRKRSRKRRGGKSRKKTRRRRRR